jgi:ligand-binding sensor domain-containing protein
MKNSIKLVLVLMICILTNTEIYGSIVSINTGGIDGKKGELEKRKIEKREVGKRESKLAKAKITIPSFSSIRCIYEDGNNNIWIGTDGDGLLKFDGKKFQKFTIKEGLSANHVRSIIQDNVGNFWISTIEGLDIYNGMFFKNVLSNKSTGFKYANCSFKDKEGTLWFGTHDGVYKIKNFNIEYISIAKEAGNKKTNREYSVHSIVQDKKGTFWFGTEYNGLCRYDGNEISFIREKGLVEGSIRSIIIDKQGLIWFGNSAGLYTYNGKELKNISENSKAKNLTKVWSIKEDAMGKIWIGTFDNGVWTIDGSSTINLDKNEGLTTEGIRTIYIDKKNKMWFGGENGAMFEFKRSLFEEVFLRDNC